MRFVNAALVVLWASYAVASVRRQVGRRPLTEVTVPSARIGKNGSDRALDLVLTAVRARCLVRAFLLQELNRARGRPLDLVIGVASPDSRFEAHAWLEEQPGSPSPETRPLDDSLERFAPITRISAKPVDL